MGVLQKKFKYKKIFKYTHEMGVLGVGVCGDDVQPKVHLQPSF